MAIQSFSRVAQLRLNESNGTETTRNTAYNFQNIYTHHYETLLYGYVWPCLGILVLILNVLMITIFIRTRMSSTTHMYLAAITTMDTLTLIFPSFIYFHMFVVLDIEDYLPYELCRVWIYFTDVFPVTFHAGAILLTVCLAGQRCLCAAYPLSVARWFTKKVTISTIVVCIIIPVIFQFSEFIVYTFNRVEVFIGNQSIQGCSIKVGNLDSADVRDYQITHFIVRVVVFEIIPCIILIVMDIVMLRKVHLANRWRKQTSSKRTNRRRSSSTTSTSTRLTILTVWIVGVFLLVELPVVVILSIYAAGMLLSRTIVPLNSLYTAAVFSNFLVLLSFPLNFFIYIFCSKSFRLETKRLLTCGLLKRKQTSKGSFDSILQRTISSQVDHNNQAFQEEPKTK